MQASSPPSQPPTGRPAPSVDGRADDFIDESLLDELSPVELQALRWSVRISDGLSKEEQADFQGWLGEAPAHRGAFEDMVGVWDAIDEIPQAGNARLRMTVAIEAASSSSAQDLERKARAAENTVSSDCGDHTDLPSGEPTALARSRPGMARRLLPHTLAALTTLAVLGGGWAGWDHWQSQPVFSQSYASERGQNLAVALPDGSGLLLDTVSKAEVTLYRQRREVQLPEGQVVFQVQADKSRPFDVLAGTARITVVGTKFSVRYTPSLGSQAVQVAVIEGRVRVTGSSAIEITAGQTVTADGEGRLGAVTTVPVEAVAAWRSRRLNFDGVPLAEVLAEIGRYGDLPVRLANAEAGRLALTASVNLHKLDAFVRALPQVLPVRLVQRGDALEIETVRH